MSQKPQSRFWAGSESSGSDSESSGSSEVEETPKVKKEVQKEKWYDSDSSEDEGARTVKTARKKAEEAFERVHKEVKNAINTSDWNSISTSFNKLPTLLIKHADVVRAARADSIENYPDYYFLTLKIIQDSIDELSNSKQAIKKLSKTNGKSFNAVRARFKKLITDEYSQRMQEAEEKISADFETEDDDESESEESSSEESETESGSSEEESETESGSSEEESSEEEDDDKKPKAKSKFFDDDDDSEWSEDSDESSSSDDNEGGPQLTGRAKWVKRGPTGKDTAKAEEKKVKEAEKQERAKQRKAQKELDQEQRDNQKKEEEEFTEVIAREKMSEILLSRGKKNVNKAQLVADMRVLANKSSVFGPKAKIPLLMHVITLQFDIKSGLDEYLPVHLWCETLHDVFEIMHLIEKHDLVLEQFSGDLDDLDEEKEEKHVVKVVGDLAVFVDRLSSEYEKSLRYMENHSEEYVKRLQHEGEINDLARRVFDYFTKTGENLKAAMMCTIILENNYYKHKTIAAPVHQAHLLTKKFGLRELWHPACMGAESTVTQKDAHPAVLLGNMSSLMNELQEEKEYDLEKEVQKDSKFIFTYGNSEMKCIATLCQVYHFALHDDYFKARDLLLMSRLQEEILNFEVKAQILFNRALVQLGFCAFRSGKMKECHACLMDLCQQGSRSKELLAQGVHWRKQVVGMDTKALEAFQKQERRRLLPFHLHINLDLLEFFHLTSAMLLEVPNLALENSVRSSGSNASNTRPISRTFRRHLEQYRKQIFVGPPENTRDHILAASQKLQEGDWKECCDLLMDLPIWKMFTSRVAETKELLITEIKKQALRTYLISYAAMYSSLSIVYIEQLFSLDVDEIKNLVNGMIMSDQIKASWDNEGEETVLLLRSNEPTHLQALAGRFAEQLEKLVEANERRANKSSTGFDGFGANAKGDEKRKQLNYRRGTRRTPTR